jgi:hypothetical protein
MAKLILSLILNGVDYHLTGERAAKAREVNAVEINGKVYSFKRWEPGQQPVNLAEVKKKSERPEGTPSAFEGKAPAEEQDGGAESQEGAAPADPGPDPRILEKDALAKAKADYVAAVAAFSAAAAEVERLKNVLGGHSVARGNVPLTMPDGSTVKGKCATTRGLAEGQSRGYTLVTMSNKEAE